MAGSNTANGGPGGGGADRREGTGRLDTGVPRGGGRWPKERSVWEPHRDPSRHVRHDRGEEAGFRERYRPEEELPPPETVSLLRQELMRQQLHFQEQMMARMEEILSRGGGGMWRGR